MPIKSAGFAVRGLFLPREIAAELSHLEQQRARGDADGGIDRAAGFAQAGRDPVVAIVEGGIAAAGAIPIFLQKNGLTGCVERVGLCDVVAEASEAAQG